jgi:hypothetical protein
MKRFLFPVLLLALALPVLTGCPQDSGGGGSFLSGHLGEGNLVLGGTVYEDKFDESGKPIYEKYTGSGVVEAGTDRFFYLGPGESLGTTALTTGEFNIEVSVPTTLEQIELSYFFDGWKNPTIEPADAKGIQMHLIMMDRLRSICKEEASNFSENRSNYSFQVESVEYFYVDRDATIMLESEEEEEGRIGHIYSRTFEAATLQLKKGWNAVHVKLEKSVSSTRITDTTSVSLGHPDLKWIIYQYIK